jgi:hypothetical protein
MQPLHGDSCTVIVEAKVAARKVEAHWAFSLRAAIAREGGSAAGSRPRLHKAYSSAREMGESSKLEI